MHRKYLVIFVLYFLLIINNCCNGEETSDNEETTTATVSYEYNGEDSETEESDQDLADDIETINTQEINALINRLVQRIAPALENSNQKITVVDSKDVTVNSTLDLLFGFNELISSTIESAFKIILPVLIKNMQNFQLSARCESSLMQIFSGLRNQKFWALSFLDASAKIPSGMLDGTVADYGEYQQCLNIRTDETSIPITGKYCMALFSAPLPPIPKRIPFHHSLINVSRTPLEGTFWEDMTRYFNLVYMTKGYRAGLCIPSTCSAQELESVLNTIIHPLSNLTVKLGPDCDTSDDTVVLTTHQIVALSVFTAMICIVVVATAIDFRTNNCGKTDDNLKPHLSMQLLLSFSSIRNTRKLLQSDTYTKKLATIHGIRIISISWILLGHVYLMQFFQIFHALKRTMADMPKLTWYRYQPLKLGSFLQVETFLLLGGVTASYVLLDLMKDRKHKFNYTMFVVIRWLRYTPTLVALILIYILLPLFGSGPIFKENIKLMSQPCEQYWWRNLLYINNYYDTKGNCATISWYLAVDFQLYILSPIVTLTMLKSRVLGIILCVSIILSSAIFCVIPYFIRAIATPAFPTLDFIVSENILSEHFRIHYWGTYQHVGPYYVGVLVGFLVHTYNQMNIWKPFEYMIWILCFASNYWSVFWSQHWMDSTATTEYPEHAQRLLFAALYKVMWVTLPAWIILTHAMGRAGKIGEILSWKGFVPFSRLTYGIYLIQLVPIVLRCYSIKYTMPFDDFYNMSVACLCFLISVVLAYFLYILFESPFACIFKLIYTRINSNQRKGEKIDTNHRNEDKIDNTNHNKNINQF